MSQEAAAKLLELGAANNTCSVSGTDEDEAGVTLRDGAESVEDALLERLEAQEAWRTAADLPRRHARILQMCFLEDLTLCEIGGVLGVTESRVCQLRREAVEMLQARRAANDNHEPRVGVRRAACAPRPV